MNDPRQGRLRILTYIHSFELGGSERAALHLMATWAQAGAATGLYVGDPIGPLAHEVAPGIERVGPGGGHPARGFAAFVAGLRAAVRQFQPDILFCPGNSYTAAAVAIRLALGQAAPPIVAKLSNAAIRPDLNAPVQFACNLWTRAQVALIDHFVAMSPGMAEEFAAVSGIAPHRLSRIPNALLDDLQLASLAARRRQALSDSGRPPQIVAVGRLAPQKDFPTLLRAFALLADHLPHRLVILGEGPERRTLERLVGEFGLEQRVSIAGYCADPTFILIRSDLSVLSSLYEGVPSALVESMACGVPVSSTRAGRSMDWLLQGLATPTPIGDAPALAAEMLRRLSAPPDIAALQSRAAWFSRSQSVPHYMNLFRTLAQTRNRKQCANRPMSEQAFQSG